jgi:type II restriction enzyme
MQTRLDKSLAKKYASPSQKTRVITEYWVQSNIFCPSCGSIINNYENNRPVADFFCPECREEFEVKSKKNSFGKKIVDGSYCSMIERLQGSNNPSLFLLSYDLTSYNVLNFLVVPKHFFVPEIIEKRKPLSQNARRAGWMGCNILLSGIPNSGKVFYIKNKQIESKEKILLQWRKTLFLRESKKAELKGWILDIMNCIDKLGVNEFTLNEMYAFENLLSIKHPSNKHIKDKIRQQLQFLRDKGYLYFVGKGRYRLV